MKKEKHELILDGVSYFVEVDVVEKSDAKKITEMYSLWKKLSSSLSEYGCRRMNFPEISELIFCLVFDCWRTNNIKGIKDHNSFDCYNPKTNARIQIKATSVADDLTSFGPKSVWDELYFMDFFSNNKYDGSFTIYLIPNDADYNFKINKEQTFKDQQKEGRRPRFHIKKDLIKPLGLKPIGSYNLYEL